MNIGERIKQLRRSHGCTQQSMADKLKLKRQTIAAYEVGAVTPSDRTITDICREFGISETWLRNGEGEMLRKQSREDELAAYMNNLLQSEPDDIKRRIVTAISHLDTSELELLEKIALQVAEDLQTVDHPAEASVPATDHPQLPKPASPSAAELEADVSTADIETARTEAEEYYREKLLEKRMRTSQGFSQEKSG